MSDGPWQYFVQDIRKGENVDNYFTILTGLVFGILGFFGVTRLEHVVGIVLMVLSLVGFSLLVSRHISKGLANTIERLDEKVGDLSRQEWPLSYRFIDYAMRTVQMRADLEGASQVWVLSLTPKRLWDRYGGTLPSVARKPKAKNAKHWGLRVLLLDPEGKAIEVLAESARNPHSKDDVILAIKDMNRDKRVRVEGEKYTEPTEKEPKGDQEKPEYSFEIKVIDHLPAWSLTFVDPKAEDNGRVYVELATFPLSAERPCAVVKKSDGDFYERLLKEFESMWAEARPFSDEHYTDIKGVQ